MKFYHRYIVIFLLFSVFFIPGNVCSEEQNKEPFLVLNNIYEGLFTQFLTVVGALDFYEKGNFAGLKVDFNDGRYFDPEKGPNWWEYFFEPINLGKESEPKYYFTLHDCLTAITVNGIKLDGNRSSELIKKYIRLKPSLQKEINSYVKENFKNYFVIGIHHRGTDKIFECPIVSYEKTFQVLWQVICNLSQHQRDKLKIFIATEDENFIKFMSEHFPSLIIYNDFVRTSNQVPLYAHGKNLFPSIYQMGKEALVDCFLLSKCNFLIRPASSCLSLMSLRINPSLPGISLTE